MDSYSDDISILACLDEHSQLNSLNRMVTSFALENLGTFKVTRENSDEDTGSEDLGIAIAKVGLNEDHQPNSFMSNSDNE